jgi:hypothetical protein
MRCTQNTQTHSDGVFIKFGCFFLLVRKVTTRLLGANLYLHLTDNLPEVLSATGEGHTVSIFR